MKTGPAPTGTPEAWEIDDLARLRKVREELEHEYLRIPERPYRRRYDGHVPSVEERSRGDSG
jgi:hypothetical protein